MTLPARTLLSVALAGLVLGGGTLLPLSALHAQGTPSAAAAPPEVLVVRARAVEASQPLRLPARTAARESARIHARVSGFVRERHVDLGDMVRQGQLLVTLATPELDAAVREAEATLTEAEAARTLAEANYSRAAALVESGAISRELYAERQAARESARAAVGAAQARLAIVRERQAFRELRAPFDGVIGERNIERGDRVVGDAAAAGAPLFVLHALDPLRVLIDVPQRAALAVQAGLAAEVTFPEQPGQRHSATVVRSASVIDAASGGMRVELQLPNPGARLPAGMVGEVALLLPIADGITLLPLSSVFGPPGRSQVARVEADDTLAFVPVQLGRDLGAAVEIRGLAVGDRVLQSPNAMLAAGTRVRVREAAAR